MKTFLFWLFLLLLVLIHTIDMELTTRYIGNQWENETFPLMSYCIKVFGIYTAVWVSRVVVYTSFIVCYHYKESDYCVYIMFLGVVVYYTAMIDWLFNLYLVRWPI